MGDKTYLPMKGWIGKSLKGGKREASGIIGTVYIQRGSETTDFQTAINEAQGGGGWIQEPDKPAHRLDTEIRKNK